MYVVTISGSSRIESSNSKLLDHLSALDSKHTFERTNLHYDLPIFRVELDANPLPDIVMKWREKLSSADAIIICIPEYIHNMPAVIKNALEWITSSGELVNKQVIPITLTPHEPRGEKAMQSLLWSLQALDSNIVVQLPMYKSQLEYQPYLSGDGAEILREAFKLLS